MFVAAEHKVAHLIDNLKRQAILGAKTSLNLPIDRPRFIPSFLFVNCRLQLKPTITRKSAIRLNIAAFSLMAHLLLRRGSSARLKMRRGRVDKTLRKESHEDNHHKRVCIVGIDRNHCPCARTRPSIRYTHSGSWKRVFAGGADSVWRCREWDQWLWPPHGPS